jgi:hypothetical protein
VVASDPSAGTLFADPDGSGSACTEVSPCDLWTATDQAVSGDVVFLRGGVYGVDRDLTFTGRGTDLSPPVFESYPGEWAILDGSALGPEDEIWIRVVDDPVVIRLLEIRYMPMAGISVRSSDHVLEGLEVHHCLLTGIQVHESYKKPLSNRNLIRDCVVHDNSGVGLFDPKFGDGGNSDGIAIASGTENRVEHCLVYGNSDDGIDTWRSENTYIGYSIVHGSGLGSGNGMGIKAGGTPPARGTLVEHNLSYANLRTGFDYNSGAQVRFLYNTSWGNGDYGFYGGEDTHIAKNIAAEVSSEWGGGGSKEDNSWQREGALLFVSEDPESPDFLVPVEGGGFEDLGAFAE